MIPALQPYLPFISHPRPQVFVSSKRWSFYIFIYLLYWSFFPFCSSVGTAVGACFIFSSTVYILSHRVRRTVYLWKSFLPGFVNYKINEQKVNRNPTICFPFPKVLSVHPAVLTISYSFGCMYDPTDLGQEGLLSKSRGDRWFVGETPSILRPKAPANHFEVGRNLL